MYHFSSTLISSEALYLDFSDLQVMNKTQIDRKSVKQPVPDDKEHTDINVDQKLLAN